MKCMQIYSQAYTHYKSKYEKIMLHNIHIDIKKSIVLKT